MEVRAPDGTIIRFPEGTAPDKVKEIMAKNYGGPKSAPATAAAMAPAENQPAPFSILPFRENQDGGFSFDSDAGILGPIKRAFNLPGQVLAGEVDPNSPEGIDRVLEMGATVAPTGVALRSARAAAKASVPAVPTAQQLKATASQGYDAVRNSGVEYDPQAIVRMAQEAKINLDQDGFNSVVAKNTHKTLDALSNPPEGATAPISGIKTARSVFGKLGENYNKPQDAAAAKRAKRLIDEFLESPSADSVVSGPAEEAAKILREANGNYAAAKRSNQLTDMQYGIDLDTAAANSGQNLGNKTRQRFASLLKSDKKRSGYTAEELAEMESVVMGSPAANFARDNSNRLGAGGGLGQSVLAGLGAGAGVSMAGPAGLLAGAIPIAAGSALRSAANSMTRKAAAGVDVSTRMRSPLYEQAVAGIMPMPGMTASREALTRALLLQQLAAAPKPVTP